MQFIKAPNGAEFLVTQAGSYTARMARDVHPVAMADGTVARWCQSAGNRHRLAARDQAPAVAPLLFHRSRSETPRGGGSVPSDALTRTAPPRQLRCRSAGSQSRAAGRMSTRTLPLTRAIEEPFQVAKNECGLDHYPVRLYRAWYRNITLTMAALAYLP